MTDQPSSKLISPIAPEFDLPLEAAIAHGSMYPMVRIAITHAMVAWGARRRLSLLGPYG